MIYAAKINRTLDGLTIGNGTVYNFIDYIGQMHITGGILNYTALNGYRNANLTNNYDGGVVGRYGYGSSENENDKIGSTDGRIKEGNRLSYARLQQDRIGDFYTVEDEPIGFKSFITETDFSELEALLREQNLKHNAKEDTNEKRYGGVDGHSSFIASGISKTYRGDENIVDTDKQPTPDYNGPTVDVRYENTREWNLRRNDIFHSQDYADIKVTKPVYEGDFNKMRTSLQWKSIDEVAEKARNNAKTLRAYNKNYRGTQTASGEAYRQLNSAYGDVYKTSDVISVPSPHEDILSRSANLIEKYTDSHTRGTFAVLNGHWDSSYGFPNSNLGIEYYSVNNTNRLKPTTDIDPTFTNASLIDASHGSYVYYQENDKGKKVDRIQSWSTSDNFMPSIDSHNNSSYMLRRTNKLFSDNTIKSLVNRFHTDAVLTNEETISSYDKNFGMSRGRNLLKEIYEGKQSGDNSTGFDNPYCRVWTAHYQYSKMKDRIRPFLNQTIADTQRGLGELRPNGGADRLSANSVLQSNGYVRIAPQHNEKGEKEGIQNYMFSIENLAWKDFTAGLTEEQRGPNRGRIMWFPPYNLKFTENVHTDWNPNSFIGRGEKIYTYKDTERSGTLDFTLLIDHPSIVNKWRGMGNPSGNDIDALEKDLLRFFAGCNNLGGMNLENNKEVESAYTATQLGEVDNKIDKNQKLVNPTSYAEYQYIIFFPNDFSAKEYWTDMKVLTERMDSYERGGSGVFTERDLSAKNEKFYDQKNNNNVSSFGLNTASGVKAHIKEIQDLVPNINDDVMSYDDLKNLSSKIGNGEKIFEYDAHFYEIKDIEVRGYASSHGHEDRNIALTNKRRTTIENFAKYECAALKEETFTPGDNAIINVELDGTDQTKGDVNKITPKIARSAVITFKIGLKDDVTALSQPDVDTENVVEYANGLEVDSAPNEEVSSPNVYDSKREVTMNHDGVYEYGNEYLYFEKIKDTDPLVYKNIINKIKYFDPAFHSLTPEGFNARLSFLHQCTRQGPTVNSKNGGNNNDSSKFSNMAANLAFGRAPYCILRIGDFYNSKICIDSISINYDNGGGTQWDLNPEGAGVQPMMANVNINFHFFGGQDISGCINQLQNAVSNHFYANESVYNNDRIIVN